MPYGYATIFLASSEIPRAKILLPHVFDDTTTIAYVGKYFSRFDVLHRNITNEDKIVLAMCFQDNEIDIRYDGCLSDAVAI